MAPNLLPSKGPCTQRRGRDAGTIPGSNLITRPGEPPHMAMKKGVFWPNGHHLKIVFMGATANSVPARNDFIKQKVIEKAKIWEKYCNIKFDFISQGRADIRIAFGPDDGSWSYLGTEAKDPEIAPPDEPTMNFGWFNRDNMNDTEFERVTVHEFGHALGCTHELQSPAAGVIKWNKQAVYDYYKLPEHGHWDKKMVDSQVLTPDEPGSDINTEFDPTSIMCYPVLSDFTTDGFSVGWNTHLSPMDEDFIGKVYPKQTRSTGNFSTDELADRHPPNNLNSLEVEFSHPYDSPPKFAYGLTSLNMSGKSNIRVATSIDKITESSCQVHADTWNDSKLFSAAVSWMESAEPASFQIGVFNTKDLFDAQKTPQTVTSHIVFPTSFSTTTAPTVILFAKGIDLSKSHNWRLETEVSSQSADGFDISIKTPGDTKSWGTSVTWLAFPSEKPGVCGGVIDTGYVSQKPLKLQRSGVVKFPAGDKFGGNPPNRVMLALNGFDFGHGQDFRIRTYVDKITETGFQWHTESWGDSLFYQAALSWVAFA